MRVLLTVALIVATCLPAFAATDFPLKTKWSVSAGLVQTAQGGTTFAAGATIIYAVGSDEELQAFDVTTGTKLWSISHPIGLSEYTVSSIKPADAAERVLVTYEPGPTSTAQHLKMYCFSAVDGSEVWSIPKISYSTSYVAAQTETLFVMAHIWHSAEKDIEYLLGYELRTGNLRFNTSFATLSFGLWAQGDIAVLQHQGVDTHSRNAQIDLNTGKVLCTVRSDYVPLDSTNGPMAGDLILGQHGQELPFLYDAKTCEIVHTFERSRDFSIINGQVYSGGDTLLNAYGANGKRWSAKIYTGTYGTYGELSTLPFQPDAVVTNAVGIFSAVNATTGAVLWNTSFGNSSVLPLWIDFLVPYAPRNSAHQQVYPLGSKTLFIPNLQGYVVVDLAKRAVVTHNEMVPIQGIFSFMDPTTQTPFVVYGDLNTGNLVAVERSAP